jgi:hypothetical protein
MSRRHIALNFRRRVFGMLSTLFRRRWASAVHAARRSRLGRRLREFTETMAEVTASSTKLVNTHLLTLSQPEFLERRALMDVGAAQDGSTLYIWMDAVGTDRHAFIAETFQGITVGTDSCLSLAGQGRVVPGITAPNIFTGISKISAYRGFDADWAASDLTLRGGTGYSDAPSITFSDTTHGVPVTARTTLNVSGAAVGNGGTYAGTGNTQLVSTNILFANLTPTGATASVDFVNNAVAAVRITNNGSGLTSLTGLRLGFNSGGATGNTASSITFTGSVDDVIPTTAVWPNGTGYFEAPVVTISGATTGAPATYGVASFGGGAPYKLSMNAPPITTRFTTLAQSNPLTPSLNFGVAGISPDHITLASGLTNSLAVQHYGLILGADTVSITGDVNASGKQYSVVANDDIGISGRIHGGSLNLFSYDGNIALTGAGSTVDGAVTLYTLSNNGSISVGSIQATSLAVQSHGTFTSTGLIKATSGVTITSDNASVILGAAGINAASSNVTLSALDPTRGTIFGNTSIVGSGLTIREGKAASVPFTIAGNVSSLTGTIASSITFTNNRSLTVGSGSLNTTGGNLAIHTYGTGSDLSVTGVISSGNATGTNITLGAAGNATINAAVFSNSRPVVISAGGSLVAGAAINAGTAAVNLVAGTGIDGGNNILASGLTADSTRGNINIASASSSALTVYSATTTLGSIALQSIIGNLVIAGGVSTTGGNITLATGQAAPSLTINAPVSTDSAGTVTLTAANYAGGTINNGSLFRLNTGTLNLTAATAPALLKDSANASFGNLTARVLGSGQNLDVVVAAPLNLTGVSAQSGNINVVVMNGDLTVVSAADAGTVVSPQNVTLSAPNGSIGGTGTIFANVLTATANGTSSLTTNVATLIANLSGTNASLTINESRDLTIGTGNTTNITTNGGDITLNLAAGNLSGPGFINAASGGLAGNVTLIASQGSVTPSNLVTANVLNVSANSTSTLSTSANAVTASITGANQSLTISEANDVMVANGGMSTNNGDISINLATGSLNGFGNIIAGSANVTLNAAQGGITLK